MSVLDAVPPLESAWCFRDLFVDGTGTLGLRLVSRAEGNAKNAWNQTSRNTGWGLFSPEDIYQTDIRPSLFLPANQVRTRFDVDAGQRTGLAVSGIGGNTCYQADMNPPRLSNNADWAIIKRRQEKGTHSWGHVEHPLAVSIIPPPSSQRLSRSAAPVDLAGKVPRKFGGPAYPRSWILGMAVPVLSKDPCP